MHPSRTLHRLEHINVYCPGRSLGLEEVLLLYPLLVCLPHGHLFASPAWSILGNVLWLDEFPKPRWVLAVSSSDHCGLIFEVVEAREHRVFGAGRQDLFCIRPFFGGILRFDSV